jgi:signal peptidase
MVMKKKKFIIIKGILIVIISILLGFGIYSWNSSMVGKAIPMPLGFGLAEVLSDSMYPTIKTGDVIMVVPQDEYKVGDIVAFEDGSMIVTHRIIEENEDGTFVTKGDYIGNSKDDMPLQEKYIIGKVVKNFAGLGPFVSIMQSPLIIMLSILIIAMLLYLSTKKEKEQDQAELAKIKQEIASLKGDDADSTMEDIQAQIDALRKEVEQKNKK